MQEWIYVNGWEVLLIILSTFTLYLVIIALVRLFGLRSLSKMTASDFATTVAVGSLFGAAVAAPSPSLGMAAVALASLFGVHGLASHLRERSDAVQDLINNDAVLLMRGSKILDEHLEKCEMTRSDLYGKLREANAFKMDSILAVVFEDTGDVSVLHGEGPLDDEVMSGVDGWND